MQEFSRIHQLLINEKFVTTQEIEDAVSQYDDRVKLSQSPFCVILSNTGKLNRSQLSRLINHSESVRMVTDLITQKTGLPKTEIEPMVDSATDTVSVLKTLEEKSSIKTGQRKKILNQLLDDIQTIRLAVELEFVTEMDVSEAYGIKHFKKSVCEILYENNCITLRELNHVFREIDETLKLGTILSYQGLITDDELTTALDTQKDRAMSLGEILLKNRTITVSQLCFALSIQYNIPFRTLNGFLYSDKQIVELRNIFNRSIAQQTEILPLLLNGNNLTVGVHNPGKMSNTNELMVIHPHLRINVTLITKSKFEQLFAILYGEVPTVPVDNPDIEKAINPEKKTVISDPFSEYRLINDLFDRYLALNQQTETGVDLSERSLFHEFIYENYKSISSDYQCNHVAFWFQCADGQTGIMASPMLQSGLTEKNNDKTFGNHSDQV